MAFFQQKHKSVFQDQRFWMAITAVLVVLFVGYAVFEYVTPVREMVGKVFHMNSSDVQTSSQQKLIEVPVTIVLNQQDKNQTDNMALFLNKITDPASGLKSVMVKSRYVESTSSEGQKLINDLDVKYLPLVLFGKEFEKSDDFAKSKEVFEQRGDYDSLSLPMLNLPPMQHLKTPGLDTRVGNTRMLKAGEKQLLIVEYASPTCVHCANLSTTITKVLNNYKGKVALIERHYDRGGPDMALENALECSGVQDKFGALSDAFYQSQTELSDAVTKAKNADDQAKIIAAYIVKKAKKVGVQGAGDAKSDFQKCVDTVAYESTVQNDTKEANLFGVYGTPGLFIGSQYIPGEIDEAAFTAKIDAELKTMGL